VSVKHPISSVETLFFVSIQAAGLEVVHEVLDTQAILISNPHSEHKAIVNLLQRRIEGFITATKFSMIIYNVSNDLLEAAVKATPGKRSPTITNLSDENCKAVSSLVLKKEVSDKMDELYAIGATDILVLDLANTRM
jgi:ATP phosphoribosyltransferase